MYAHISILFKNQSQKIYDERSKRLGEKDRYFKLSFEGNFVMIKGEYLTEYILQDDIVKINCTFEEREQTRTRF